MNVTVEVKESLVEAAIAEAIVADELEKALRAIAKKQIKLLKDSGELGGLFNE